MGRREQGRRRCCWRGRRLKPRSKTVVAVSAGPRRAARQHWPAHASGGRRRRHRALVVRGKAVPGVIDAAVLGVPHAELGEEVGAFVVVSRALGPAQLASELRESLASFAIPSKWWVQSDPLPVNQTGKVDKVALAARARQQP